MKRAILYLVFVFFISFYGDSQEVIKSIGLESIEMIRQIPTQDVGSMPNIQTFQHLNCGVENLLLLRQIGNENKTCINLYDSGSQIDNGVYIEQTGVGNMLSIAQIGSNNGVLSVQQGSWNIFSAEQMGSNNRLVTLQKGNHNSMTGFRQQNYSESILYDQLVQIGNNLNFSAEGIDGSRVTGNNVMQVGNNLSFQVNTVLSNTGGGIKVNQTGSDMRVVVEQSYFYFPLK